MELLESDVNALEQYFEEDFHDVTVEAADMGLVGVACRNPWGHSDYGMGGGWEIESESGKVFCPDTVEVSPGTVEFFFHIE